MVNELKKNTPPAAGVNEYEPQKGAAGAGLVVEAGTASNLTATGDVTTADAVLLGFYVNSTTAGTLVLKRGGSGGTALGGTITPAVGYHAYPAACPGGVHATIGGTLNATFFYREG